MTVAGPIPPSNSDPLLSRASPLRRPINGSSASSSTGYPDSSKSDDSVQSFSDFSKDFQGMSLSSTSSRDSLMTVISDGAFTDYLSSESEAEVQKQAEIKAAQLRRVCVPLFSVLLRSLSPIPAPDGGCRIQSRPEGLGQHRSSDSHCLEPCTTSTLQSLGLRSPLISFPAVIDASQNVNTLLLPMSLFTFGLLLFNTSCPVPQKNEQAWYYVTRKDNKAKNSEFIH